MDKNLKLLKVILFIICNINNLLFHSSKDALKANSFYSGRLIVIN